MAKAARRVTVTPQQVSAAIATAVNKVQSDEWSAANYFDLEADWERLLLDDYDAQREALMAALREVSPSCWNKPKPPGMMNEPSCRGAVVFQFAWNSTHFGRNMFFRFALAHDTLYISSLHPADFPI